MYTGFHSLKSKLEKLSEEDSKLEKLSKVESKLKKQISKEDSKSECTIYRVYRHLRNVNSGAYEPQFIAIGPYHHDKDHLKMMENHKLRNVQSVANRLNSEGLGMVFDNAVYSLESSKARKCYHQDFELTDDEFKEMLVLDGCFIVELVRKYADGCLGKKGDDPIFGMDWMIISLQRDLMLFENQIPFFVLRHLFHHIKGRNETRTLLQLLTNFFSKLYPGNGHSGELLQVDDEHEIKHLLDLIHRNWVLPRLQQLNPSPNPNKCQTPNATDQVEIDMVEMASGTPLQDEENEVEMGNGNKENSLFINHATELTEANVECQKPNLFRTMCCMPVKERKYKEVMMGRGMLLQGGKENEVVMSSMPVNESEIVLGSMPVQERKENEDMTGSMPLKERKENEVVLGSMPVLERNENKDMTSSMPLQERKENEVVLGSMPLQHMKGNEVVIGGISVAIDGSSMPVLERKETDQLVGSSMPVLERKGRNQLLGSSMPVLERKKKGGSSMPVLERKENEDMTGSMPLQERKENKVVLGSTPKLERKYSEVYDLPSGCSLPVLERNETDQVEGSSMPLQDKKGNADIILFINHAIELTEANVEFEKPKKETILFDVYFEDGAMVMPPLLIQDGTECFLRNLIVYEQYFRDQLTHTVVTDYMKLLDNLIDSAKDVALLSKKGIIINLLGDAEVVANMVNSLGDLVICGGSKFSYATMFEEVKEHCRKPWNRWMAKLRRDYLNSPWAIISIIAAVVLLLLTVTQTILSILQVVQEN